MRRILSDKATGTFQGAAYDGTEHFQDTDPLGGTQVTARWLEDVQEEICNAIEAIGGVVGSGNDQLGTQLAALDAKIIKTPPLSHLSPDNPALANKHFGCVAYSVNVSSSSVQSVTIPTERCGGLSMLIFSIRTMPANVPPASVVFDTHWHAASSGGASHVIPTIKFRDTGYTGPAYTLDFYVTFLIINPLPPVE